MNPNEDLEEKKLLGSGGYAFAKLTEQEEIKASLGVPQIFLSNLGRLNEDRFTKYYCNKCAKEYPGSPSITYENPNEEVGQGIILILLRTLDKSILFICSFPHESFSGVSFHLSLYPSLYPLQNVAVCPLGQLSSKPCPFNPSRSLPASFTPC
jgi:hypothetical protein